uniref:Uncharacterized protein n=1 Tax=Rhizophagus irregularis (strain DAOM 181602 / DAOM 197198 / MUCL 43194) TaxID=747089 RepID=U9U407_RHIID
MVKNKEKVFGGQYTPEEFPLQTKGAEIGQGYYQSARPTKGNNSVDSAPNKKNKKETNSPLEIDP